MARRLRTKTRARALLHQVDQHDSAHAACPAWRHRTQWRIASQPAWHLQENADTDASRTGAKRPDRAPHARFGAAGGELCDRAAGPADGWTPRTYSRLGKAAHRRAGTAAPKRTAP